jgi:hypothetical protein
MPVTEQPIETIDESPADTISRPPPTMDSTKPVTAAPLSGSTACGGALHVGAGA